MPFRAKCPACGRKQSLQDGEIGHTVWCSACGNQFVAASAPAELNAGDSSIPDIDFPTSFASPAFAAAPPPPPTDSAPPPPQHIPPMPVAAAVPGLMRPEPIVPSSEKNHLVPILISLVVVLGIALIGALFTIVYLINRPTPAATALVIVPPTHLSPASRSKLIASSLPSSPPASRPVAIIEEPLRTTTTAPAIVQIKPQPRSHFVPVHAPANPAGDLDDQIGNSIDRGVNFLLSQFVNGKLRDAEIHSGNGPGTDALAVYALLQAGEATHDLRLGPNSPLVAKMLDELKSLSMDRDNATYSHSLRSAALSVYHRAEDKQALRADAAWLISNSIKGAYTYGTPSRSVGADHRLQISDTWDNSNSQYGALGVWAALEAGVEVPNSYWMAVDKHWLSCQLPDGEWAYTGYGDMGRMSMTVAGITTSLVAEDQLDARTVVATLGHPPFAPALLHGLNWLEAGNNSVRLLTGNWRTYSLFGLERAALASGFKYFGTHDWYRELATQQLNTQESDGSWTGYDSIVDTSYTLLFLSRGRHPIFMNKLRFDGFWANRPRDIANLAHYASSVLERPVNWQVVSLKSNWSDWMDSPVLYIASHEALNFTEDDCDKLRAFAENGGLIFTHADGETPAFNKSIPELARRLFPQYPLADLLATHPIFSTLYKIKLQPRLQGISNGSRLLLVNSPTDLDRAWQQSDWVQHPVSFQMGINIFIYAAGKTNLRNKLKTPLAPDVDVTPILTASIAELKYAGNFNPEPAALPRFVKLFLADTSVKLNVIDTDPSALNSQQFLLAHLTGIGPVPYDTARLKAIHDYVANGGLLLIDACGASPGFLNSMVLDFLPHAFPQSQPRDMPADHPILAGTGAGMTPVNLRLRPYRSELDGSTQQPIQFFTLGKGMVIFSPVDLTTGLLGTNTWGVNGYEPATVYDLVRNILLCSLEK